MEMRYANKRELDEGMASWWALHILFDQQLKRVEIGWMGYNGGFIELVFSDVCFQYTMHIAVFRRWRNISRDTWYA